MVVLGAIIRAPSTVLTEVIEADKAHEALPLLAAIAEADKFHEALPWADIPLAMVARKLHDELTLAWPCIRLTAGAMAADEPLATASFKKTPGSFSRTPGSCVNSKT